MKSSAKNVKLASVDDLFSTEESRADASREKVVEIPLSELHPFKDHPFKVKDDEAMMETADSIRQYGVLVPAIVRPDADGGYELVAGHRRHHASELAGKETMPCIVRDLDDDAATIIMVDSNLQREELLPSERAFAYKMKLEAMKHQGERVDLTCSQVGNKFAGKKSSEILAEQVGQSKNQIFRFIRLTELIPPLLEMMSNRPKNPKYARNKNVLIIGGSGSGKTRFWLKPNLMQCTSKSYPTSFVVTDPKGSIVVECGKLLQRNGYRIKIMNTINFKKSMHYNPFSYIHSEKDILKLVTTLIANTKGEGKGGDDFWLKAETLLYTALIGYIHYEAPEEEQNFSTLIEFLNAMETREDDEDFQNPVDLISYPVL